MPVTCFPHRDWLFYVLYCGDISAIRQMIRRCISNILDMYSNDREQHARMALLLENFDNADDSLVVMRLKYFLLLNMDEKGRVELTKCSSNIHGNYHSVPVAKANLFYNELHNKLIPQWVSNENMSAHDLVDSIKMAYLIS